MEKTLCIIKPDIRDQSGVVDEIRRMFESKGMSLRLWKKMKPVRSMWDEFYKGNRGKDYQERNLDFMVRGHVTALVWEGVGAVAVCREIVGDTDPKKAKQGTIRQLYGAKLPRNAVHVSKSKKEFNREMDVLGIVLTERPTVKE